MPPVIMGLPERFWAKTRIEDTGYETPCLTWTAYKLPNGYGRFNWQRKVRNAHRLAYEVQVGPIPEGLVIDHLCRNRACVNVAHMEPVTNQVNILRGETIMADNAAKTRCSKGHLYDETNTIRRDRGRRCATCETADRDERNAQRRAETAQRPPKPPRTHCRQGHLLDEANTYVNKQGVRCCRECARDTQARYRERKRHLAAARILTAATR